MQRIDVAVIVQLFVNYVGHYYHAVARYRLSDHWRYGMKSKDVTVDNHQGNSLFLRADVYFGLPEKVQRAGLQSLRVGGP